MIHSIQRYCYMIAASFDSNIGNKTKKLLLNAQIHIPFLLGGLILVACHGSSTIFLDEDQFFFDQGKYKHYETVLPYQIIYFSLPPTS